MDGMIPGFHVAFKKLDSHTHVSITSVDTTELIRRAQTGERSAIEDLVSHYQAEIRAYAVRVAPRLDLADDLAQEVFCEALRSLHQFKGDGPFIQWLRGITRNVARAQWRRHALKLKFERDALAGFAEELATADENTDDSLILNQKLTALRACMAALTPRAAELIEMRHRQGLSTDEIAAVISGQGSAVRTALSRIHARLRDCMTRRMNLAQGPE